MNFLKANLLDPGRTTIKEIGDKNWESVLWNNDNYRPDKTAKAFNDFYNKQDKETQRKLIEDWTNTNKVSASYAVGIPKIVEVRATLDTDFSRAGTNTKEGIDKFMQEVKNSAQWEGTKFAPKPNQPKSSPAMLSRNCSCKSNDPTRNCSCNSNDSTRNCSCNPNALTRESIVSSYSLIINCLCRLFF